MTQAFNLSQFANKVNTSGQADLTTAVTGTLPVTNGGTGVSTLTTAYGVLAAGTTATGALQNIGTGTSTQVLTSNGPGALPTFQTASGGAVNMTQQVFYSPGTWTKPTGATSVRVTVVGAGGGGLGNTQGNAGNTSSFGALASATGGGNSAGTFGAGTTTGTLIRSGYLGWDAYNQTPAAGTVNNIYWSMCGFFEGWTRREGPTGTNAAVPYAANLFYLPGARGNGAFASGFPGGYVIAQVPVTAPVAVTVGTGGDAPNQTGGGGGCVLVEYIA